MLWCTFLTNFHIKIIICFKYQVHWSCWYFIVNYNFILKNLFNLTNHFSPIYVKIHRPKSDLFVLTGRHPHILNICSLKPILVLIVIQNNSLIFSKVFFQGNESVARKHVWDWFRKPQECCKNMHYAKYWEVRSNF